MRGMKKHKIKRMSDLLAERSSAGTIRPKHVRVGDDAETDESTMRANQTQTHTTGRKAAKRGTGHKPELENGIKYI